MSVSRMNVARTAGCSMVRARKSEDQLQPRGRFVVEHFRKGEKIGHYEFPNGIANEGKNKLLDVMFHGVSAITTWWLGLIDNSGYRALAADGHLRQHRPGRQRLGRVHRLHRRRQRRQRQHPARVDGGRGLGPGHHQRQPGGLRHHRQRDRQGPVPGGRGIANAQNKGDHQRPAAVLWATALFGTGDVPVNAEDQLKVTYTVSA